MIRGSAPPIWENSLESDKLRAVPSAQTEKEPQAALFLCAETLIGVWKYACKVFCAICIRIRSPRQSERRGLLLESDKLRAAPSAQSKKEPQRGSFSLRGNPYCRMEIRRRRFPHNLHPNPQPSAKRDILPGITNCWDADPSGFAQRAHNSVGAIHESPAAPR